MIEKQNDLIDDVKNNQDEYVLEKKSSKQENRFSEFKNLLDEASSALQNISENTDWKEKSISLMVRSYPDSDGSRHEYSLFPVI